MFDHVTDLHPLDMIGIIGFGLYIGNYAMITLRHAWGDSIAFFLMNLAAASCVMIGLFNSFNLASAMIQGFWIIMSLIGIGLRLNRRNAALI